MSAPNVVQMDKKRVKDYMTYDVISVDIHGTAKDVIEQIKNSNHDGFPVVDGKQVVGYVAARDLLFVHPEASIEQVMNQLLGIISNSDVIRSQIEHVSPEKVFNFITTLKKLYGVDPSLNRGIVPIKDLLPTQSKIYEDELEGRIYEIKKGLAEPIIVVKRPGRTILVDGHHRAIAAKRLGITALDAYIIEIGEDIELGLERTANAMNLKTLDDVQVLDYARHPLVAITHRLVRRM